MHRSPKLQAADRRQAILAAAVPVFARLGRAGATTREIAHAAGVSEALLFRHFPTKDALHAELETHCVEAHAVGASLLDEAAPSTATLVKGIAVLVQAIFPGIGDPRTHDDTARLVTASLTGDGRFATLFLDRHVRPWVDLLSESLDAAHAAGDLEGGARAGIAELWFAHHLASTLHLLALSGADVVDHRISREALTASAVRFLLRGLGLTQAAIERHYDPGKMDNIFGRTAEDMR